LKFETFSGGFKDGKARAESIGAEDAPPQISWSVSSRGSSFSILGEQLLEGIEAFFSSIRARIF
jgi:hypothetical protein